VEDYLTVLSELLEQMNPPVIAVASSLTAGILIRLAIAHPELVRLLFLVSPTGFADFGSDYGQNAAARIAAIPGIDRLIYTLGAANELAVRNFLEQFLLAERSRLSNETVAAYLASAQQFNAEYSALASLRGDLCFDLSLYIQQLSTPTAFVVGEKSRFGSPKMARRLADLNRSTVQWFWEIPQVGVLPHLETPAVVAGLLAQVLQCA
jgi:pimeloyl-ACP methyl ester carboxylesterase